MFGIYDPSPKETIEGDGIQTIEGIQTTRKLLWGDKEENDGEPKAARSASEVASIILRWWGYGWWR